MVKRGASLAHLLIEILLVLRWSVNDAVLIHLRKVGRAAFSR